MSKCSFPNWRKDRCSSWTTCLLTAGCIDTGLPAGRRYFGQSDKPLVETAYVHHARWVMFTETHCHKPERVRDLIEERGCELLYLPSYSPDYNPIEEAFSKIKEILRRAAARAREALVEELGLALSAVSREDARGFFEHAGYRLAGQLL